MPRHGSRDMSNPNVTKLARITMMPEISAAGDHGPPLFVMKGTKIPYRSVIRNGIELQESPPSNLPRHSVLAMREENGGVDRFNFFAWARSFVNYASELTENERKVLLTYDGYQSHLSLNVLELLQSNNVIVYALPSHTSGKTQPCDCVLFSSSKHHVSQSLHNCVLANPDSVFDVYDFCSIIRHSYERAMTGENIRASIRRSGLWTLDPSKVLGVPRPVDGSDNAGISTVEEWKLRLQPGWRKLDGLF